MRRSLAVAVLATVPIGLVVGCSSTKETATATSAPVVTTTQVAPDSEQALSQHLEKEYKEVIQAGAYEKMWDWLSPRCQSKMDKDALTRSMKTQYANRDFSGPQRTMITMRGQTAQVVKASFDGKGDMKPSTYSFINGQWRWDDC